MYEKTQKVHMKEERKMGFVRMSPTPKEGKMRRESDFWFHTNRWVSEGKKRQRKKLDDE